MIRRIKCLFVGLVFSVCLVYMGKMMFRKLTYDPHEDILRHRYSIIGPQQVLWYGRSRRNLPMTSPRLVWPYGEGTHPYFLSPVLQFEKDIFRRRSAFNLTALKPLHNLTQETQKLIVFYNMPVWHTMEKRYKNSLHNCPVRSCRLSDDKDLLPTADAVIFYVLDFPAQKTPPPKPANQMWVFFAHEAPWDFNQWNDLFNWTMTFRFDSDIVCPYFVLILKPNPDIRDFKSITKKKSATVMWLVSHCGARSKRDDYVKELQKHIQVDIYGGCGSLKCSPFGKDNCNQIQNDKYKFYLAFENSLCRGYVTEKLFRCYTLDIIPVVRGGARYADLLPRGTYIDTADFPSQKHLADYLKYLDKNVTAYAEMLERKSQYTITDPKSTLDSSLCDICVKLHDVKRFSNAYSDINKWWNTNSCVNATDVG